MDAHDSTKAALNVDDGNDAIANAGAPLGIIDTDGSPVVSSLFYKLLMSDGTELGMTSGFTLADESPSNGGAIIQFSKASPLAEPAATLFSGDLAYVRGASYEAGSLVQRYLYIFKDPLGRPLVHVGWTSDVHKATRFQIVRVVGSRVSWHAQGATNSFLGIRLDNGVLEADTSNLRLPLAARIERVESLPVDIRV